MYCVVWMLSPSPKLLLTQELYTVRSFVKNWEPHYFPLFQNQSQIITTQDGQCREEARWHGGEDRRMSVDEHGSWPGKFNSYDLETKSHLDVLSKLCLISSYSRN